MYIMASSDININSRIIKKKGHLSSRVDNELVILNIDKGEYNGLDEIGSDVWSNLETPLIVSDLVANTSPFYLIRHGIKENVAPQ